MLPLDVFMHDNSFHPLKWEDEPGVHNNHGINLKPIPWSDLNISTYYNISASSTEGWLDVDWDSNEEELWFAKHRHSERDKLKEYKPKKKPRKKRVKKNIHIIKDVEFTDNVKEEEEEEKRLEIETERKLSEEQRQVRAKQEAHDLFHTRSIELRDQIKKALGYYEKCGTCLYLDKEWCETLKKVKLDYFNICCYYQRR